MSLLRRTRLLPPSILNPCLLAPNHWRREKELAAVKLTRESVDAIVQHFELDRKRAERVLREHGGDVRLAVDALLAV